MQWIAKERRNQNIRETSFDVSLLRLLFQVYIIVVGMREMYSYQN